jgi:hypothetical protein
VFIVLVGGTLPDDDVEEEGLGTDAVFFVALVS